MKATSAAAAAVALGGGGSSAGSTIGDADAGALRDSGSSVGAAGGIEPKAGTAESMVGGKANTVKIKIGGVTTEETNVRCAFFDGNLPSRDAIGSHALLLRLKRAHACDQWHSSRVATTSYRLAL
jgi:hypothetical protein